jgi:hypothetical protein
MTALPDRDGWCLEMRGAGLRGVKDLVNRSINS